MNLTSSGLLKESLERNECVWVNVVGKSMLPFLRNGTLVAVRKANIEDIHVGDIILFKKDDIAIAHRVVKKINSDGRIFLRTKSDISFISEPLISYEELMGKVVAFKRFGREIKIDNFLFRTLGLSAGFLFPFVARARFLSRSITNYAIQS